MRLCEHSSKCVCAVQKLGRLENDAYKTNLFRDYKSVAGSHIQTRPTNGRHITDILFRKKRKIFPVTDEPSTDKLFKKVFFNQAVNHSCFIVQSTKPSDERSGLNSICRPAQRGRITSKLSSAMGSVYRALRNLYARPATHRQKTDKVRTENNLPTPRKILPTKTGLRRRCKDKISTPAEIAKEDASIWEEIEMTMNLTRFKLEDTMKIDNKMKAKVERLEKKRESLRKRECQLTYKFQEEKKATERYTQLLREQTKLHLKEEYKMECFKKNISSLTSDILHLRDDLERRITSNALLHKVSH